ncbi:MAG: UMP kinase [Eubacterium sp.]|jgi:uridylate kinase|nr:UMP kinase [Eubacterium sp.]MCH4046219.1 UMP kinase [Eubacterium sp.]MCH4079314.1 UMP kinase [Eubacterium sp.]MCH4110538.1 UMP kinase [Eubacterium sp.]MCI1307702.1 UMP kinase [Eubacterium sp.]
MEPKYNRVLLKISGEALSGGSGSGINEEMTALVAREIKQLHDLGVEVAIVVGGGNFWRGRTSQSMKRETADYIGMLATVMNSLALQDALLAEGVKARVQTSITMNEVAEPYIWRRALKELSDKDVVIFGAGIGEPHFSTDTAAALRAVNIDADIILLAKNIDAVYSADPKMDPNAVKYDHLTMKEVVERELKVMDLTAATICMENNMKIQVFGLAEENSMVRAVCGEQIGTLIE